MDRGDIEEAAGEEEFPRLGGGKYRPVGAHDRAVVEMSSIDPGSSSSSSSSTLKYDCVPCGVVARF